MTKVKNAKNYNIASSNVKAVYGKLLLIQAEDCLYPNHTTGHQDVLKHLFRPIFVSGARRNTEPLEDGDLVVIGNKNNGWDLIHYDSLTPPPKAKKVLATWNHISGAIFNEIMNKKFDVVLIKVDESNEIHLDKRGYITVYHKELKRIENDREE